MTEINYPTQSEEMTTIVRKSEKEIEKIKNLFNTTPNRCIGCGGRATKVDNSLCLSCWANAENQE